MASAFVRDDIFCAWRGPALLVTDRRGNCGAHPLSGFYYREARYLRTIRLEINGREPWLCEAAVVAPDRLEFAYGYPEISNPGGGGTGQSGDEEGISADGLPERSLDILLSYRVDAGRLRADIRIANRARRALTFDVGCALDADFADILESQSGHRQQEAAVDAVTFDGHVEFRYGHARLPYRTSAMHRGWGRGADGRSPTSEANPPDRDGRPPSVQGSDRPAGAADPDGSRSAVTDDAQERVDAGRPFTGRLSVRLTLAPQETHALSLTVAPLAGGPFPEVDAGERHEVHDRWRAAFTRIRVPGNRRYEAVVDANVRDVASFPLLDGARDEWLALQAGVPAYPAFFGRDAVTAGWQAALLDGGESLEAAFVTLARLQADGTDAWRDAQPGRIPYQVRSGPLATLNINPFSAYYADFASPLMFVISLANLYAWTGDRARIRRFWDAARRMLDWARDYGDADGDGYLEYQTRSPAGPKNQGWKDSGDAIVYADGSPVPAPIATCEVQGYWYIAQHLMGLLSLAMGAYGDARAWRRSAVALKTRFNRDWWDEGERFFALALDRDKRKVCAVTSNVGHCLATGIIDRAHVPAVVGRLFAPDLFSGWGVRTLSSAHAFYNPLSYHRGSVWAVEQATIVFGLRRFGFNARALDLTRALFDLALLYPDCRIPECVGGYSRGERPTPGAYPRANTPQLWNATAFPLVVQAMLGLAPLAPVQTLIVDPVLPAWMPEVVVEGLRVGEARVSLRFRRNDDGASSWDVLHKSGTVRIIRQPPPESFSAGLGERLGGLLQSAVTGGP